MYANFTEETCTGTGDVLTLTGASSGSIPFSASFEDGDLVAYVAEDDSGSKVAGVGTYNAGTITRNDTWNYNGTSVDKNPTTNISLSGGEHVVRCDIVSNKAFDSAITKAVFLRGGGESWIVPKGFSGRELNDAPAPLDSDRIRGIFYQPPASFLASQISFDVSALSSNSAARFKVLLYVVRNGEYSTELLFESAEQDGSVATGSTGVKTVSFGGNLLISESDIYGIFFWSNDDEINLGGASGLPPCKYHFTQRMFGNAETIYPDYGMEYTSPVVEDLSSIQESDRVLGDYRVPTGVLRSAL